MSATTVQSFIGGRYEAPGSEQVDPIPNPATGQTIAMLPYSTPEDIDRAIRAAREAFPGWSDTPAPDRAQVLFRLKALLEERFEDLARLVTEENGKTIDDARGEVRRAIEVVDFACGAPTLLMGTNLDQIARGIDEELTRFPVGVVAGITPFNFPNMVPMWMIPVALACGNTFVFKPSQRTPLSGMLIAELLVQAGLPDGVFNVVHG
ncbi:MAG TPA: aldehyde dehydrogenase family protein, partial [Actinomycetota bacterium]|nr:aldehyde dehydrogenase family protein [Actinomycetota bacterium]